MIIISLQQQQKQHQQISQLKLVSVKHKQNKKLTEYFCWHCNNQEHLRQQHLLIKRQLNLVQKVLVSLTAKLITVRISWLYWKKFLQIQNLTKGSTGSWSQSQSCSSSSELSSSAGISAASWNPIAPFVAPSARRWRKKTWTLIMERTLMKSPLLRR